MQLLRAPAGCWNKDGLKIFDNYTRITELTLSRGFIRNDDKIGINIDVFFAFETGSVRQPASKIGCKGSYLPRGVLTWHSMGGSSVVLLEILESSRFFEEIASRAGRPPSLSKAAPASDWN